MWVLAGLRVAETWAEAAGALGAVVGIVVALVAVKLAKDSAGAAERSAAIADEQLVLARAEHVEFMRQLSARARFQLHGFVQSADADGVLRIAPSSALYLSIEVRIENGGEKAAGETMLVADVPRELRSAFGGPRWHGPDGEATLPGSAFDTDAVVALRDGPGKVVRIAHAIERVGRSQPLIRSLSIGTDMDGRWDRPFAVRIWARADELPEGEPLPYCDVDVRIERQT